jgi:RecT family
MNNQVALVENPRPNIVAGSPVRAIVPQTFEEAYRIANAVHRAGMAPKGFNSAEMCMIAIMHGAEIGIPPMLSLQRIAVVNGRPTLWGDGVIALVRASGLCEYIDEEVIGEGDKRIAVCRTKRKGEAKEISRKFSVADAKTAGLWGKSGPWTQYPERMLQMRARAFAMRDAYPDAMGGMYLKEEADDFEDKPAKRAPTPPVIETTYTETPPKKRLTAKEAEVEREAGLQEDAAFLEEIISAPAKPKKGTVAWYKHLFEGCADLDALQAAKDENEHEIAMFNPDALRQVLGIYNERLAALETATQAA